MEDYLVHTKDSFNKIADAFDEEDSANEILQWMRDNVHEIYQSYFKKGDRLLELNAGTGIDAVYLASKGIKVFATDISDEMIDKIKIKIGKRKLHEMIRTEIASFNELGNINESDFDGAVSNFGGLNCINNFDILSGSLAHKIKPGGKFIAAVMNSICPWEIFYYMLKIDPGNAFRRFYKSGIYANLSEYKIKSFYFTPKDFARRFQKHFDLEKIYSLGLFTPSPYLYGIYIKAKPLVKLLMKIDDHTKKYFPFNRAGDHFVIVLKRKQN